MLSYCMRYINSIYELSLHILHNGVTELDIADYLIYLDWSCLNIYLYINIFFLNFDVHMIPDLMY